MEAKQYTDEVSSFLSNGVFANIFLSMFLQDPSSVPNADNAFTLFYVKFRAAAPKVRVSLLTHIECCLENFQPVLRKPSLLFPLSQEMNLSERKAFQGSRAGRSAPFP